MLSHLLLLSPPILSAIPFCPLFSFHFILFLPPFFVPLLSLRFFLFSHFLRYSLIPLSFPLILSPSPFISNPYIYFPLLPFFLSFHLIQFHFKPILFLLSPLIISFPPLFSYSCHLPSMFLLFPSFLFLVFCIHYFLSLSLGFLSFPPLISYPLLSSNICPAPTPLSTD